jgi:hypothetical protein
MDKELSKMTSRQIRQLLEQMHIPYDKGEFNKKNLLNKYSDLIKQSVNNEEEAKRKEGKINTKSSKKYSPFNDSLKHTKKYKMRVHYTVKQRPNLNVCCPGAYLNKKREGNRSELQECQIIKKKVNKMSIVSETIDTDQQDIHKKNLSNEALFKIEKPLEKRIPEESYNRIIIDKNILSDLPDEICEQVINPKNASVKIVYDSRNEVENKEKELEVTNNTQFEIKNEELNKEIPSGKDEKNEEINENNRLGNNIIKSIRLNIKKDKDKLSRKISHEEYNFEDFSPSNKTNGKLSIDLVTTPSSSMITPSKKEGISTSDFKQMMKGDNHVMNKSISKKVSSHIIKIDRKLSDKFLDKGKLEKQQSDLIINNNKQNTQKRIEEYRESRNQTSPIKDIDKALIIDEQTLLKRRKLKNNNHNLSIYIFILSSIFVILYVFIYYYSYNNDIKSIKLYVPLIICTIVYGGCVLYMNSKTFKYKTIENKILEVIKKYKCSLSRDDIISIMMENLKLSKENFLLSSYSLQIMETLSKDTDIEIIHDDREKVYFKPVLN